MRGDPGCRRLVRPGRFGALLACIAIVVGCGDRPDETPAPVPVPEPEIRVLLIGDSITAGLVSAPKGPPYATLVAQRLAPEFEIVNLGCGGTSSLDWTRSRGAVLCGGEFTVPNIYERRVLPALPADIVTVMLGTNDSQGIQEETRVPVEDYEAALREICTDLLADGAGRVMLIGPPLVIHKVQAMLRLVAYGDALRRVCEEMDRVVCGPDVRMLLDRQDFAIGNIHPNRMGHVKIADALVEALRAFQSETGGPSREEAAASNSPG